MSRRAGTLFAVAVAVLTAAWTFTGTRVHAQAPAETAGKTAAQAYKNIQILKDIPADQLLPSMQFISASLGVECSYCHVDHAFDKDDKRSKQTARQMMTMMFAIDKNNFNGRTQVTCYTCHRGSPDVIGVPEIPEEDASNEESSQEKPAAAASQNETKNTPQTTDQILAKYIEAIGGAEALGKVTTRVEKGHLTVEGKNFPIEVFMKAPDKRESIVQMPNGPSITAFDGTSGWLKGGTRPSHEMNASETSGARVDAELSFPGDLSKDFDQLRTRGQEEIGDREENIVYALKKGEPPVKLYFDSETGLLTRAMHYTETPLGRLPVQIDFADYRPENGVKVPHRWILARVNGSFTITIDSVQQNVPIEDAKFSPPAK